MSAEIVLSGDRGRGDNDISAFGPSLHDRRAVLSCPTSSAFAPDNMSRLIGRYCSQTLAPAACGGLRPRP